MANSRLASVSRGKEKSCFSAKARFFSGGSKETPRMRIPSSS
jgi:hypothetical protein